MNRGVSVIGIGSTKFGLLEHMTLEEMILQACGEAIRDAGMAGRTNMVVGYWRHTYTHVPILLAVSARKQVNPDGELWRDVLACTGQPKKM